MTTQTDRLAGARSSLAFKAPVDAATTANIVLSGEQTIDGVAVAAGDRVLVKDQSTASENGIYIVTTTAWARARDLNSADDVTKGTRVFVKAGSVNSDREFQITTTGTIAVGTTDITIARSTTSDPRMVWQGAWLTATSYSVDDTVENDGSSYICTTTHTSGSTTEPGVGASWETNWDLVAAKGEQGDPVAVITPDLLGQATDGSATIDESAIIGGYGTWNIGVPTRPAYDVLTDSLSPVSSYDLDMTGHAIDEAAVSAVIVGGRPAYYSYVGPTASLSMTYGGDNINNHLAGINLGYHCDLIKDDNAVGSHGAIVGGSFKKVSGDYSFSFGGQIHEVHGVQSGVIGGRNIKVGDVADSASVRRSVAIGGESNYLQSGQESFILGGNNITLNADSAIAIASDDTSITGFRAAAIGCKFGVANVPGAITRAGGKYVSDGDAQTHHVELLRRQAGTAIFPSWNGGSGLAIITPPPNSHGSGRFQIDVVEENATTRNGASYDLAFRWSNIGGTLTIVNQTKLYEHEDDVAFNCAAEITAGGTRVNIRVTTPNSNVYLVHGTGSITLQTITV